MKRYLSVFGLAARSSFWQGLALMIVSVALAGALLYLTPGSGPVHYVDEYGADQTYEDDLALSELPKASKLAAPLAGGLGDCALSLPRAAAERAQRPATPCGGCRCGKAPPACCGWCMTS